MDKQPIDQLLNEISKLLDKLETAELKPENEWPKEFKEQMKALEDITNQVTKASETTLKSADISKEDLERVKEPSSSQANKEDQQILNKIDALTKRVKEKKNINDLELTKIKYREKIIGKEGKEKIKRKKRFLKGGREDWKPL